MYTTAYLSANINRTNLHCFASLADVLIRRHSHRHATSKCNEIEYGEVIGGDDLRLLVGMYDTNDYNTHR